MSRLRQRRRFFASERYANRCSKVTAGRTILLWSWARRAERFYNQDRSGTPMAYGWRPQGWK